MLKTDLFVCENNIVYRMPNIHNVISDIKQYVLPDARLSYEVQHRGEDRWIIYVRIPHGAKSAKLEFLIDQNPNNPEDVDVAGSVLRHGSIHRRTIATIMDSIVERL
jgi:hypothetical protein